MLIALVALVFSAAGAEELCFSRENAPYWHRDAACRFAEAGWYAAETGEELEVPVSEAEAEGQKPCPGCAAAFKPMFTGDFPDWPHDVPPWGADDVEMTEESGWPRRVTALPAEVLKGFGDPAGRLNALFPDGAYPDGAGDARRYPDDFAGVFINNCECCTIMLKAPTPRRVMEWRDMLGGEFWVISAKYGYNELFELHQAAMQFMEADVWLGRAGLPRLFHIVSLGVDQIGNALVIGVVAERFDAGSALMRGILALQGFGDPGMLRFAPAAYPGWGDEDF